MKLELDWQAGTGEGEWETIAIVEKGFSLRVPRWVWRVLLPTVVILTAAAVGGVRHRYARALRRIVFQIQDVIDLEARALARDDLDLFLAQQDEIAPAWYTQQVNRFWQDSARCSSRQPGSDALTAQDASPGDCASLAPPQVQEVELRGDVAWVEVVAAPDAARQARFYRQTERGWLHTAPRDAFWQGRIARTYGQVTIRAHQRDLPHIEPLVAHILSVAESVSEALGGTADSVLGVDFLTENLPYRSPGLVGDVLALPSPWLTGIPVDGRWDEKYLQELSYWVTYGIAAQVMRSPAEAEQKVTLLDPLRMALVDEYAVWQGQGDATRTPILRRIVEQHGADAIPAALHSLADGPSPPEFIARWLFSFPPDADTYAQTLRDVGYEALQVGRTRSFALADLLLAGELVRQQGIIGQYDYILGPVQQPAG